MSVDANSFHERVLRDTMEELSALRQKTLALPDQSQIDSAIEAIDFYETNLPTLTEPFQLVEWCGRALADVRHEVAAAEYGFESSEAEAAYEEGERGLRALKQAGETPFP